MTLGSPDHHAGTTSLRTERNFVRWATAEGVSMLGSSITTVVLPLVVYDATGSAALTGLLFAARVVPYLLFGLVAGPVANRGNRRWLIIGSNVVEGTLAATIPLAHLLGVLTVTQVYVVAIGSATAFVFSDAAVFGAVPALVGPARLARANGFLASLASGAEIAGPVVAGILLATVGAMGAVSLDAASFFAAAAVQSRIRSTFRESGAITGSGGRAGIRSQVGRAIRFIRGHRTVATLLAVGFGNSFAFGAVLGLLVPYAVERLGIPSDDARTGMLYAAGGVGSLVAGMAFSRLFRPERVPLLTPATLLASGILAAGLAVNASWLAGAGLLVVFSMSITTTIVIGITYRQLAAPDDLRSSINVIGRMIAWGGQPFGAAVGALVAVVASVPAAYGLAAVVMLATGVSARVLLRPTPVAPG